MLMPHSITDGDACFAYFNKRWGIPEPSAVDEGADSSFTPITFNLALNRPAPSDLIERSRYRGIEACCRTGSSTSIPVGWPTRLE
jgi:hypothetical protein